MKLPSLGNIFRQRLPGRGVVHPPKLGYAWEECVTALQNNPQMHLDDFFAIMVKGQPAGTTVDRSLIEKYYKAAAKEAHRRGMTSVAPVQQPGSPAPAPQASTAPGAQGTASGGILQLVNYTPEQLVSHVDQRVARIQFGWSFATKWMENYSEVWSWIGPIILVIGTIGEVFLVLWLRQRIQDILAGVSIVAVALVLECTFLAVSYKAATIRNRTEKRPDGQTELDKKKLRRQFAFWVALGFGVCATQVIFIVAQTYQAIPGQGGDIGVTGVWIFAILRALFTLVADGYTAFAHEEKPTTADRALEEEQQRTKAIEMLLDQKQKEVDKINAGIERVREATVNAQIRDDKLTTRLTTEQMQNRALVEALQAQQDTARLTVQMLLRLNRAIMDPSVPAQERQEAINIIVAMGKGYDQLKAPAEPRLISSHDTGDL